VRILFVSRCLPYPLHFGDSLLLHYLTRELASGGHELDLIALTLDSNAERERPDQTAFRRIDIVKERPRTRFDYLARLARPFPPSEKRCWNPGLWHAVHTQLDSRHYDLVHVFGGIQVYEIRDLITRALPTIIVPFDCMSLLYARHLRLIEGAGRRLAAWGEAIVARAYERRIYDGFGRVVLVSPVDEAFLLSLEPALPTAVIPNGIDAPQHPAAGGPTGRPTVIFVGNFGYAPNLDAARILVSDVLPLVWERVPDVHLLLVGADPPGELLEADGERVKVTGYVPNVRHYLGQASCFVSPLRAGAGMRNKILEAMSEGVPVVGTRMSCEGIDVTDGSDVLLAESPVEMAGCVCRLLADPVLTDRIGAGGRRLVQRDHTWASVAEDYERLYAQVVAEFGGTPA
jgi:glycosyltransferase involved in cell wall biosynthesis